MQGYKVVGMIALALVLVACLVSLSEHMGSLQQAELLSSQLHGDSAQDFDVADAILNSAGVHDKHGSISASMAALAAQVCQHAQQYSWSRCDGLITVVLAGCEGEGNGGVVCDSIVAADPEVDRKDGG